MTKIIICSDGTGNSGGSGTNTNVWRIYNAIDTSNQIRIYGDGVGTNKNTLFKMFGLVFGWGLSRNIRQLYKELVLHYQHGEQTSEIYLIGFSRGSHTVRLLAELICTFGILNKKAFENNRQLDKAIQCIQNHFKSTIKRTWVRKLLFTTQSNEKIKLKKIINELMQDENKKFDKNIKEIINKKGIESRFTGIKIKFIGVWDTVSAVGVPIDELRDNYFFASHAFVDNKLNENVEIARHALAIDEMRHTFKPELWDQSSENDQNKIKQVWFAGVHSNVGGGYPKDQMSVAPLTWMIDEARSAGIQFNETTVEQFNCENSNDGKMYDSRSGVSAIFRYKPRNIFELTQNANSNNEDAIINIHPTVYNRIRSSPEEYAPTNLTIDNQEHIRSTQDLPSNDNPWNIIWCQRLMHFVFIVYFVLVIIHGYNMTCLDLNVHTDSTQPTLKALQELLNSINTYNPLYITNKLLPGYANNPSHFFVALLILIVLMYIRNILNVQQKNLGNYYWNKVGYNDNKVDSQRIDVSAFLSLILKIAQKSRNLSFINAVIEIFNTKITPILATAFIALSLLYFILLIGRIILYLINGIITT